MTRPEATPGRRREQVLGAVVVVVGVAVLVLSIVALLSAVGGSNGENASAQVTLPSGTGSATATGSASGDPSGETGASGTASTSGSASATGTPTATGSSADPTAAIGSQPLLILNNTGTKGLAAGAATRFEKAGWTITDTGNADVSIPSTCAYYDPAVAGAQAAATALQTQFPTIARVEPKLASLPRGPVVVVLDSDYTSS